MRPWYSDLSEVDGFYTDLRSPPGLVDISISEGVLSLLFVEAKAAAPALKRAWCRANLR